MKLVQNTITIAELQEMSKNMFSNLVKAVVDLDRGIMAVDAELHVDLEEFLLEQGSEQDNLWGINLHPYKLPADDWIEFDSMINIRPLLGNKSRSVENPVIRQKVIAIVNKLVAQ